MTPGSDGNIWMTESTNNIRRMTPTGVFTEFPIPRVNADDNGITNGPNVNVWFTEGFNSSVGKITPSGAITEFSVGIGGMEQPNPITQGPDGRWRFSDDTPHMVGAITTGLATMYPLPPTSSLPTGIKKGSDGNVWICARGAGIIDRLTPTGTVT